MTSREFTSGFDFWSSGYLCMAVVHLPIKFNVDICIHSRVIAIISEIRDDGRRHLGFVVYVNWRFRRVDSMVFVFSAKFCSNICYIL